MQVFLPYPDFKESLRALDSKRLGKQRVEAMQIITVIKNLPTKSGKKYKGWINHPCSIMWHNFVEALKLYHNLCIEEWIQRGYNNKMQKYELSNIILPFWLGNYNFHASHRSNLLRKDFKFYKQYNWTEDLNMPYFWLDKNNVWWYKENKEKIYINEKSN